MIGATTGFTLIDRIESYNKADLVRYADYLNLTGISKLRKDDLVELIYEKLLEPETQFYRMSIFDDSEIDIFEKAIYGGYQYSYKDQDRACTFNEMDLGVVVEDDVLFIFPESVEAWESIKGPEFNSYRKKASWVWKCLVWCEDMYGITPIQQLMDVIHVRQDIKLKETEIYQIFNHFPKDRLWTVRYDSVFIESNIAGNKERILEIKNGQGSKPYYIPSQKEVEELHEYGYFPSAKPYQDMADYLTKEHGFSNEELDELFFELFDLISSGDDFQAGMQHFFSQVTLENEKQTQKASELFVALANGTRLLMNRGYTPDEALPAEKSLSASVKNDTKIKVYPNDPCPCGSGKKYKKCCGKA